MTTALAVIATAVAVGGRWAIRYTDIRHRHVGDLPALLAATPIRRDDA